jgi:hypothetical protein
MAIFVIFCGIPPWNLLSPPRKNPAAIPWFSPPPFDSLQEFVVSSTAAEANEANPTGESELSRRRFASEV